MNRILAVLLAGILAACAVPPSPVTAADKPNTLTLELPVQKPDVLVPVVELFLKT